MFHEGWAFDISNKESYDKNVLFSLLLDDFDLRAWLGTWILWFLYEAEFVELFEFFIDKIYIRFGN